MPTAIQQIGLRKIRGTVPANDSTDFDTLQLANYPSTKYLIRAAKPDASNFQTIELTASRIGNEVDDIVHTKFPLGLSVTARALRDGTDALLRVTNNEAFDVDISIVKINT